MGDRCSLWMMVRKDTAEPLLEGVRVNDLESFFDDTDFEDEAWMSGVIFEANYALESIRSQAAKEGSVFAGEHGPGDEYGSYRFFSDGKEMQSRETGHDGGYVVHLPEKDRTYHHKVVGMCKEITTFDDKWSETIREEKTGEESA